jgi:YesN/AraC family two-component response regulator
MRMISHIIREDPNLNILTQIKGKIPPQNILSLKYLNDYIFDIQYIYDYSSVFFLLFHENEGFVSSGQISDKYTDFYDTFFKIDNLSSEDFKAIVKDRTQGKFLYADNVKYYMSTIEMNLNSAILFVEPIINSVYLSKASLIFAIAEDRLVETLLTPENIELGMVHISDAFGKMLVNYGDSEILIHNNDKEYIKHNGETFKIINYTDDAMGLNITVGFPMNVVDAQIREMLMLLLIYAGIGFIIACMLSLAISLRWYKPLSNLLKEAVRLGSGQVGKNEFDYIRESLLRLVSVRDELETKMLLADAQKQAIKLENIFIKGFYEKGKAEDFLETFPLLRNGFYIAYLQVISVHKTETPLLTALDLLETYFAEGFLHVRSMDNTEILLIPAVEGVDEDWLKNTFSSMSEAVAKQWAGVCYVGISRREADISNINVAYANARQTVHAFKYMQTSFVEFYQYIYDHEIGCFNMLFLNKLYDMILCGAKQEISKIFAEIKDECVKHKERYEFHKAEIFYAISFVKYATYKQLSFIPAEDIRLIDYQQNHSLVEFLSALECAILDICDKVENNKKSKRTELRDNVTRYIESNFSRAEMTAELAAEEIGISEKYLFAFIKEHTGKTFSVYLEELRIQYAKKCLEDTNMSNEAIARAAGFGAASTFYRVFKKYTGMSPSLYKKNKTVL